MPKHVKVLTVVHVGGRYGRRYGPGKARLAADAFSRSVTVDLRYGHNGSRAYGDKFRDFHEKRKVAFRRSLPIFEKLLGPVKNRTPPP